MSIPKQRTVVINRQEYNKIIAHGEEQYNNECCGLLLGSDSNELSIQIKEAVRTENVNTEMPKTRYTIDPLELLRIEDYAETKDLEVLGIYHSHPDHPAKPSNYDLEHSFCNLSYIVMRIANGKFDGISCWRRSETEDLLFIEEKIVITE